MRSCSRRSRVIRMIGSGARSRCATSSCACARSTRCRPVIAISRRGSRGGSRSPSLSRRPSLSAHRPRGQCAIATTTKPSRWSGAMVTASSESTAARSCSTTCPMFPASTSRSAPSRAATVRTIFRRIVRATDRFKTRSRASAPRRRPRRRTYARALRRPISSPTSGCRVRRRIPSPVRPLAIAGCR